MLNKKFKLFVKEIYVLKLIVFLREKEKNQGNEI